MTENLIIALGGGFIMASWLWIRLAEEGQRIREITAEHDDR